MPENEKVDSKKTLAVIAKKKGGRPKGPKNKKSVPKTRAGAGMRYDAKIKAKILAAAKGKFLAEAHAAAVGAGYRGNAARLYPDAVQRREEEG